jgi:hypothetical protein
MSDQRNLELLQKLKALAERGEGGEKETAQKMLEKLMVKYGVEEADLSDDKLEDHDFRFHTKYEKRILKQVMYKVADGRDTYTYRYGDGSRTTYGITCTKAEALQIQIEYEFYVNLWYEELDFFLRAFIQKHSIFDLKPGHATSEISEEDLMRMMSMMQGMKDATLNPMLEEGEDNDA